MSVAIKLGHCQCGAKEQLENSREGSWVYCPMSRWYNRWQHRSMQQIAWYPHRPDYTKLRYFIAGIVFGTLLISLGFLMIHE